jgi:hypothetical protein
MFILIILVVVVFFVLLVSNFNKQDEKFVAQHKISVRDLIDCGTYVSGHPSLDDPFNGAKIQLDFDKVKVFTAFNEKASIPKSSISNVLMEDSSTIQTRVGIKRLLLTGIFAFAWKKKQKLESAYIVIEWKQGQFSNETIFEFEGTGSIQKANTLRNKFINYLSTEEKEVVNIPQSENDQYLDLIKK